MESSFVEQFLKVLEAITPVVGLFVTTGLAIKYLPFLKWFPNEAIKVLNGLIAFFFVLGGTAPAAHAGFLGDVVHQVGIWGKAGASVALVGASQWVYESFLRGWLDKIGVYKSDITKSEIAAKKKLVETT